MTTPRHGHQPWSWTGPRALGLYLLILGLIFSAFGAYEQHQVNGQSDKVKQTERCLARWAAQTSERSGVLSRIASRRTEAQNNLQRWTTEQNVIIARTLRVDLTPRARAKARRDYARATVGYLHANERLDAINARYARALRRHPVPKLKLCKPFTRVITTTRTATATATRTETVKATATATRPGPTRYVPGPTVIRTRTVTAHTTVTRTCGPPECRP